MKNNHIFVLLLIVILGLFLRFYLLGEMPVGFHRDEAFFGYNAYSLSMNARDMTGHLLPLHLQSFLNSPALYSYFAVPFIYFFDLSAFSTRLPSAFFGTLSIIAIYYLALKIFHKDKFKNYLALISALMLAISPWHINLSRVATENIIVIFFIILGVLFFILGSQRKSIFFQMLSFVLFFLTLFIYQAPRAFLPLFIPVCFYLYSEYYSKKQTILMILLYGVTIIIPVLLIIFSPTLSDRIQMLSITHHPQTQLVLDEYLREDGVSGTGTFVARMFHNKAGSYIYTFLNNYFEHFTFSFLFSDNSLPMRYKIPGEGLIYISSFILFIAGIFKLYKTREKQLVLLLSWILLVPVGSALTFDDIPNVQRTVLLIPAFFIISSQGVIFFYEKLKNKTRKVFLISLAFLVLFEVAYFSHQYFVHSKIHMPNYRNEGYKELVSKITALPRSSKVLVTDKESDPYIFFMFYTKLNPILFQERVKASNYEYKEKFDNVIFVSKECPLRQETLKDKIDIRSTYFVNLGTCNDIENAQLIHEVKRSDDSTIFQILEYTDRE